jgi:hypothetical protein
MRALLVIVGGAVLAVVLGLIGYQFRADGVGIFLGMVLGAAPIVVIGFILEYFVAQRRDDG